MRITALNTSLAAVLLAMDGILQVAADDGGRDLTAEEQAAFDAKLAESATLEAQICREKQLLALKSSAATPITVPGAPSGGTVAAAPAEKVEPGVIVGRIACSLAATGGLDQRAMAAHAAAVFGDQTGQIVANMEQSTAAKGGYLVDTQYSRDFVDLLRPRVVIRSLGARSIPMPDGNITMRKKLSGTSASYVGERIAAPTTDLTVGQFTMSAKRLTALVPITNQLIRRASWGVDMMVRDDLLEGAAIKEDQQFLRGTGTTTAPAGLKSLMLAGNQIAMTAAPTLITVTNDLRNVRLKVINANVPMISCGWIMSPRSKLYLETLRDGNGNLAFAEISEKGTLYGYPIGMTTSVPDNLGVGTNESEIYFGDFSQFLIGDTYQVTLAASTEAAYDDAGTIRSAFSNDETVIRLIEEHDTQIRYDVAFAMLTGVTWGA